MKIDNFLLQLTGALLQEEVKPFLDILLTIFNFFIL